MTAIIEVPVGRIEDNPYQTAGRGYDLESLMALIVAEREALPESRGLIAVPKARLLLDGDVVAAGFEKALERDDAIVQLAVGHRRRMAFSNLAVNDSFYSVMPLEFLPLTDAEMADLAWSENHDRLDLSPPDKAMAIRRVIDDFGYTQTAVGERWGLSQSAVSNLLRILSLPEGILSMMRSGYITERHGRALLPAMQVDDRLDLLRGFLVDHNGEVVTVSQVEDRVRGWLVDRSLAFDVWNAEEFAPESVPGGRAGLCIDCEDCEHIIRVGHEKRCDDAGCFAARRKFWNYDVRGPEIARMHYEMRGEWVAVEGGSLRTWVPCTGCRRSPGNFSADEEWLKSSSVSVICPACAKKAGLSATLDEFPEVSPAPSGTDSWSPSFGNDAPPVESQVWASEVVDHAIDDDLSAAEVGRRPVASPPDEAQSVSGPDDDLIERMRDRGREVKKDRENPVIMDVRFSIRMDGSVESGYSPRFAKDSNGVVIRDSAVAAWKARRQEIEAVVREVFASLPQEGDGDG
ncbi:MAG: hypothetical protein GVY30_11840 [Chloroflexi bacterium]|jgi:ParB/RepB/Spo0J family partition protein|nr:hypothetical protein [Chloroflexota bacterium]